MKPETKILLLFTTVIALSSCTGKQAKIVMPNGNDPIPVSVMEVSKELHEQPIHTSGQFTTNDEAYLSFKTGGVINNILVKEGESIHQGQLLATLDLTEINTLVEQANLAYEKADRDYNRARNLQKDSVATLEQMQNAKTALDLATQQLTAARFNQKYSEIRAVTDGYILKKFANVGQIAGPGTPVFQTNGVSKSNWVINVGVSDNQWAKLKLNDKATITTDAMPGIVLNAIVSNKSEGADPISGVFTVELKLIGSHELSLAAGLFGKATIYPSQKTDLWAIPYAALLDGNNNTGYVFVTYDNKTAHKIPVIISEIDKDQVFISGGLENTHSLIVAGSAYLSDSSQIIIK